jgi:hypothetical protein
MKMGKLKVWTAIVRKLSSPLHSFASVHADMSAIMASAANDLVRPTILAIWRYVVRNVIKRGKNVIEKIDKLIIP